MLVAKNPRIRQFFTLFIAASQIVLSPTALARPKRGPVTKSRTEIGYTKDIPGEVSLKPQHKFTFVAEKDFLEIQDGKLTEELEYFKSPRCYLHLRKNSGQNRELSPGQTLRVSKIDNIYSKGSVRVTFWFDRDPIVSDLACVTNYNHTLTVAELKGTLGELFEIAFPKSVEAKALLNTAPSKNAKALSEDSPSHYPLQSARFILSDS